MLGPRQIRGGPPGARAGVERVGAVGLVTGLTRREDLAGRWAASGPPTRSMSLFRSIAKLTACRAARALNGQARVLRAKPTVAPSGPEASWLGWRVASAGSSAAGGDSKTSARRCSTALAAEPAGRSSRSTIRLGKPGGWA